jgi:hypothetical protein
VVSDNDVCNNGTYDIDKPRSGLIFLQYIIQDFDAVKVHARGLQQIVALKGGINSLDKFGFFKRRVIK